MSALLNVALADRYEIEREVGSGGMATVYLAHEKKHHRKVAIKILHAELAAVLGAERFLREIRVTANLQHPHILGLIDSGLIGENAGEFASRPYYVMPYVDGESLRRRLVKEQQLPIAEAVRIATQVAGALDYAHRHGVIHRDIKPENILLHDGSAIVADFGIALAITEAGGARITQTGLSLGTPSYMSPEQALGERVITARSDVYSLGAVCYEMLSGEPPFTGPTLQAIIARVMTEEPRPLTVLRRNVPPHVAAAVSQALERIPADRFASANDFADALQNPTFALSTSRVAAEHAGSARSRRALHAVTGLAILLAGVAIWGWMRPAPAKQVVRYTLVFDSTEAMVPGASWTTRLALSRDGSRVAYIGGPRAELLIRPRNQLHATAVPGSEGVNSPFFSPDGRQVGVLTEKNVRLLSLTGSAPIIVTDTLVGQAGASWGPDGFIYAEGRGYVSLLRVEARRGAVPRWFTVLDTANGELDHTWPDLLPNGKGVLFTVTAVAKNAQQGRPSYSIAVAEIPTGKHRVLVTDAMYARYAEPGQLLYVTTNRTLMAVPFDQSSMKTTGEPIALVEGMRLGGLGSADLVVSGNGTLLYATGAGEGIHELVWVTRDGKTQSVDSIWQGFFYSPALSPDGTRVALESGVDNDFQIWIKHLDKGPAVKLSFEGTENFLPAWTPDGRSVTYTSNASGSPALWTKRADGSAQAVLQPDGKDGLFGIWSPDGKWLISRTFKSGNSDIQGIRPGIDSVAVPLLATKFAESYPAFSPDGRWLAYLSDETGRYEVYVVPFPNTTAAKWRVSTHGGTRPLWSRNGTELFYVDGFRNFVAVAVKTIPTFSLGRSTTLFRAAEFSFTESHAQYAVAPDDRRFLMIRPTVAKTPDKLLVVENWYEELRAKMRK